jgi:hypothetical protein
LESLLSEIANGQWSPLAITRTPPWRFRGGPSAAEGCQAALLQPISDELPVADAKVTDCGRGGKRRAAAD